jgi:hypothetical protein
VGDWQLNRPALISENPRGARKKLPLMPMDRKRVHLPSKKPTCVFSPRPFLIVIVPVRETNAPLLKGKRAAPPLSKLLPLLRLASVDASFSLSAELGLLFLSFFLLLLLLFFFFFFFFLIPLYFQRFLLYRSPRTDGFSHVIQDSDGVAPHMTQPSVVLFPIAFLLKRTHF